MSEQYNVVSVSDDERFIKNYKAVYQAMTAKHDCKSKIFPRKVKVEIEDILDLNDRVSEKFQNYEEAGFSVSVTVSFIGRQTMEFSSWREFENHKWNENNAINSITIIWEFNAVLPQYRVPQKHVLVVKIADELKPQELLNIVFAGKLENIEEIENQMYPIVARVDFINSVLGDELLHIVEEWNKGLKESDVNGQAFPEVFVKHRRKIAFAFNYISNVVILVCCLTIVIHIISSYEASTFSDLAIENICNIIWLTGWIFILAIFVNKISQWLANVFYRILGEERLCHVFDLNKGDKLIQMDVSRAFKKNKACWIASILGTFILNLLCTIISTIIVH